MDRKRTAMRKKTERGGGAEKLWLIALEYEDPRGPVAEDLSDSIFKVLEIEFAGWVRCE